MSPNSSTNIYTRAFVLVKITALAGVMLAGLLLVLIFPNGRAAADPLYVLRETLIASNATTADDAHLGSSAAFSGDTAVIGAPDEGDHGVVYVYVRPSTGWANIDQTETAILTLPAGAVGAEKFGSSVAISGDTVVVGAIGDNSGNGGAYVFVRPESGWASTTAYDARLAHNPDVNFGEAFGESVDISGDTIVVGAPLAGPIAQGKAFVFERPSGGWTTMTATIELTNTTGLAEDDFGGAVAVNAGIIVVGATGVDVAGEANQGAAYVFEIGGDSWSSSGTPAVVLTSTGDTNDLFGSAVDIREDGKVITVGAENADLPPINAANGQGAAYVYMQPTDGWSAFSGPETALLSSGPNASSSDLFGTSLSISNDTIVVGAPGFANSSGAAFVYVQPFPDWLSTDAADAVFSDGAESAANDEFGAAVATFGGTIVAGVPGDTLPGDPGVNNQGSARVYENSYCSAQSGAWSDTATWVGSVPTPTNDACISTGHVVTVDAVAANNVQKVAQADVELRRLLVDPGAKLDLNAFTIAVSETVENHGTLVQQQFQTNGTGKVELLNIQTPDTTGTVFRGADVDTAADLGGVTLTLRTAIDWFSPTSVYAYCTADGAASPNYVRRCFNIEPAVTNEPATLTLWALEDELNGVDPADLMIYRFVGGNWEQLTPAVVDDSFLGIGYMNVSGPAPGFSFFLIGDQNNQPTAVELLGFGAASATALAVQLAILSAAAVLGGATLFLWTKRKKA